MLFLHISFIHTWTSVPWFTNYLSAKKSKKILQYKSTFPFIFECNFELWSSSPSIFLVEYLYKNKKWKLHLLKICLLKIKFPTKNGIEYSKKVDSSTILYSLNMYSIPLLHSFLLDISLIWLRSQTRTDNSSWSFV